MSITLGLDLGPNSIGWALVDQDANQIVNLGVRVFPEGVDNFDTGKEKPPNEDRRIARGMRRQIRRRAVRKRRLRDVLIGVGLFPTDAEEQQRLLQQDPYELRARALDEPVTAHELGRILLQINQRRGFLSNRKKERKEKEVKGMLAEISELASDITLSDCRTLGEYLHRKANTIDHRQRSDNDHIRNRHTRRQMLVDEFDAIWTSQSQYHPDLLTDKLRYGSCGRQKQPHKPTRRPHAQSHLEAFGLEGMIFFQRPMYWPRSIVGACELEPKHKRCPRADRRAQCFRMFQELNNLRYIDPDTGEEHALLDEQRALLVDKLATRKEMTFEQIKKALGFLDTVRFNLEEGKRPKLQGMVSDHALASKKGIGTAWHSLPEEAKNNIVNILALSTDDDETHEQLVGDCGLTSEQADGALTIDLPAGYVMFSLKAIEKLLPYLKQGMRLMANDATDSAMHAAGYLRPDELQRRLFDQLPDPARTQDARIGDIPNPVVKRALVELRKLVNAIIREHGKPDAIHVEMAREVRQGPKARKEYSSRIAKIRDERDHAASEIRTLEIKVNRDSILQYLLWQQQDNACVYCGQNISQAQLFGGEIDVDHILPYSRSLDDAQMNKVICHRRCNASKTNTTPYEWLASSDPKKYEQLCQRTLSLVRKGLMPYKKYRLFIQKELKLDDFIARQLTATAYITKATSEYLRCLFEHDHEVVGIKGQLTAELRRQWGLNDVLRDDQIDRKSRDDHRHHTIDAVVIALTDRKRLGHLSRIHKSGGVMTTGEALEFPWNAFRDDVITRINDLTVSHRSNRKVTGSLHEDTVYGTTERKDRFVVRKPLDALSPNEIPNIRDPEIRRIIQERLAKYGIEIGRGKNTEAKLWREAMSNVTMPSGVPIKRVRVLRADRTIAAIREGQPDQAFVKPGSTHHVALFEWKESGNRKQGAVFVTMLEAINRVKRHEQVICRCAPVDHPTIPSDAKFLFSLSRGEMVVADWNSENKVLVFKTGISTNGMLRFVDHTDSRRGIDQTQYSRVANKLHARKVVVDLLGRIRWAND